MSLPLSDKTEQLADAFRIFNELSENLTLSYQSLEKQVAKLHAELAVARNERLKTLLENEKIAARLQQILGALPAGIVIIDAGGRVVDCNPKALEFLDEPLLGMPWFAIAERSLKSISDNPHERQLPGGQRVTLNYSVLADGAGLLVLLADVSEMRALQDLVEQQKNLSAMGEMVASMAHQVRTPLSTAILYASQLARSDLPEYKRQQFSRKILERLRYLERQVNDMLMFAKEGRLSKENFALSDLLSHIEEAMADRLAGHAVEFRLHNQAGTATLAGNEPALRGAIVNLLNNALEACGGQGRIALQVERSSGDALTFTVSDNGPGIEPEQLKRIFEPFYSTKSSGTGLGLAVVDSVVKAHQGCVRCHSIVGQGAHFVLEIPVCTDQNRTLPGGYSGRTAGLEEILHEAF
ncbi:MAG: sensor histidine kinase FleS [Methylomicrobium sp.]